MATEISKGKFSQETGHGRIITRINHSGVFIQEVVDSENGQALVHDEKFISFQDLLDLVQKQDTLELKYGQKNIPNEAKS